MTLKGNPNIYWSKEEEQFLLNNYPTLTAKEIALKINKTFRAVQQRMFRFYRNAHTRFHCQQRKNAK